MLASVWSRPRPGALASRRASRSDPGVTVQVKAADPAAPVVSVAVTFTL